MVNKFNPLPWLVLLVVMLIVLAGVSWFTVRTFSLALELGFFEWFIQRAAYVIVFGAALAAIVKATISRKV